MALKIDSKGLSLVWLAWLIGCGEGSGTLVRPADPVVTPDAGAEVEIVPVGPPIRGLHVVGNRIQDAEGKDVVLHGVNRSGSEYQCAKNSGVFDGPSELASIVTSIEAMATWKINAVRVPLNEACWLGINGVLPQFGGDKYKQAIIEYVNVLRAYQMVPILDLHWVAPGTTLASDMNYLVPMPDESHALDFWSDVATTFKDNDGVIFELFNEPFPDSNQDSDAAWECWRDGCSCNQARWGKDRVEYQAVGMQALVDAVRQTGARNLILLGGVEYSNALTQWSAYRPNDPLDNLGAAWHVYGFNRCAADTCWNGAPATLASQYPVVATEFGDRICTGTFLETFATWLDGQGLGYLAWTWNDYDRECIAWTPESEGQPFQLIEDYTTGTPNGDYGEAYHQHLVNNF